VRHVLDANLDTRGFADAPRLGELGVHEHGAGEPHDLQHVGERVQSILPGNSGVPRKSSGRSVIGGNRVGSDTTTR